MGRALEHGVLGVAAAVGMMVVVLGVCLLLLWYDTLGRSKMPRPVRCSTADLLRRATSGSILLSRHVSETTRRRTLFNLITAAGDWYHCGMLVRRPSNGELYVLDCMADGSTCAVPCAGHRPLGEGGPRLIPALQFMLLYSLNPGVSVVRLLRGGDSQTREFDRRAWLKCLDATRYDFLRPAEFAPKLVQGAFERLVGSLGRRSPESRAATGVFCSENLALVLTDIGVLDARLGAGSVAPWSYCREAFDRHVLKPYSYSPLVCPDVF